MKNHPKMYFFLLLLLGSYSKSFGQIKWVDTTITQSVHDEDVVIKGSNTLSDNVCISAVEKDVRVTLVDNATITGSGVSLSVISGVDSAGKRHAVQIALNDKVLHITDSITLNLGSGNELFLGGGELSIEDDCVLVN